MTHVFRSRRACLAGTAAVPVDRTVSSTVDDDDDDDDDKVAAAVNADNRLEELASSPTNDVRTDVEPSCTAV